MFDNFDFAPLRLHAVWLMLIYAAMLVAMAIDFICGIRKAKIGGIATNSKGYKMTCDKAVKYFFPMLCLTCIDILVSAVEPLPFFTLAIAVFNIGCEFASVFEKTHEKKEIRKAEKTMNIILENKDELAGALAKILKELLPKDSSEPQQSDTSDSITPIL